MSYHTAYTCNECEFSFWGGTFPEPLGNDVMVSTVAICTHCFSRFWLYSEDLRYPSPSQSCFLLDNYLNTGDAAITKSEEKEWRRRIKRAKGLEKKETKHTFAKFKQKRAWEIILAKVQTGIKVSVHNAERGLIHFDLESIHCPNCHSRGTVVIGFEHQSPCPKCKQGTMYIS